MSTPNININDVKCVRDNLSIHGHNTMNNYLRPKQYHSIHKYTQISNFYKSLFFDNLLSLRDVKKVPFFLIFYLIMTGELLYLDLDGVARLSLSYSLFKGGVTGFNN